MSVFAGSLQVWKKETSTASESKDGMYAECSLYSLFFWDAIKWDFWKPDSNPFEYYVGGHIQTVCCVQMDDSLNHESSRRRCEGTVFVSLSCSDERLPPLQFQNFSAVVHWYWALAMKLRRSKTVPTPGGKDQKGLSHSICLCLMHNWFQFIKPGRLVPATQTWLLRSGSTVMFPSAYIIPNRTGLVLMLFPVRWIIFAMNIYRALNCSRQRVNTDKLFLSKYANVCESCWHSSSRASSTARVYDRALSKVYCNKFLQWCSTGGIRTCTWVSESFSCTSLSCKE